MKLRYKILIAVGAGVVYFLFQNYVFAATPTTNSLQQAYKDFNEDYFLGQLPKNTEVVYSDITGDMGWTYEDANGKFHIVIDKTSNPVDRQAKLTELHEMCHIKNEIRGYSKRPSFDIHGTEFDNCMVELAQRGAFKDLW